ncbi:membrane protein, putative [Photobacterium sp. SKA34]|uniref:YibE/F family protein n=1 Tax=Photobacterium sp. SKA34 TaxID=121723 RepID=UPI00006BA33F|nr:YibE/F family protein [Photobacterium sp. SKA34]EAR56830.1 membrane protein, putative [Photobacterium sp. SKA34]
MFQKYVFPIIIFALSTAIFLYSPLLNQSFHPNKTQSQHFVSAKVENIIDENVFEDDLAPGIYRGTQRLKIKVLEGEHANETVEINNPLSRQHNVLLDKGSEFILMIRETIHGSHFWAFNHQRTTPIYTMAAVFIGLILFFGGRAGLNAVISLYFTAALIIGVLIPAIFDGINPALVTIELMAIKIVVNFILVSGYNKKSLCAILGTLVGVIMAGIFAQTFGEWAHLSGIYLDKGEDVIYLATENPIQVRWLMFVTIMIAALGAVMDVAISIASSYQELQQANPKLTPKQLMLASMNIGKDIMGTMTNTLILAFAGSSLTTIMMVWGLSMPVEQFMNTPVIALSIIHGLAGSIGIVLTIPFTAFIASKIFDHHSNEEPAIHACVSNALDK